MVLLIDANIVLDYLLRREPFYPQAKKVMELCSEESVDGYIALHSVTTIWYLLRKIPDDKRRTALRSVCELLRVVGASHDEVMDAINDAGFKDFEDCVQSKCALEAGADYIVTRNKDDYSRSGISVVSPDELFEMTKADGM